MKGHVGDRLVLGGTHGAPRRIAVITGLSHEDGSPPYRVRWLDSGRESLVFPQTDCHIEPANAGAPGTGP
jgi:hypothetical protein